MKKPRKNVKLDWEKSREGMKYVICFGLVDKSSLIFVSQLFLHYDMMSCKWVGVEYHGKVKTSWFIQNLEDDDDD